MSGPKLDLDLLDEEPELRFQIESLIGEGSFGEVHKALDIKTGKHVAVKIFDNIQDNLEEIEEDYKVLSTHWIHPNIPHFVGIFLKKSPSLAEDDQIWLAMELCGGGSVTDLLQNLRVRIPYESLHESEIAYILSEVCNALVYLHGHCRIHRDVKGKNILITNEGNIKLIDYGSSCEVEELLAKRHTSVGTPYWMAPEVIMCDEKQCHEYDSRCDVWSLGITAIELADGNPPLGEIHPMRALFQIPRNPPPTLKDDTQWSPHFVEFISECLVKNYEERPLALEIAEHPFLQVVPKNPSFIRKSLIQKIEQLNFTNTSYDATVRGGKLKIARKSRLEHIEKEDLAALEEFSEEQILETLHQRYQKDKIYSYIGDILVAINPYKELTTCLSRIMCQYRNASQHDQAAHVFAVANKAYHAMIHEAKNQRFVISGESGAGKTVTANLVTKMLVYLGRAPHRNIEEKILQLQPILEAFGNARTHLNENSSRFAKHLDLTFSKIGKVTGARISVFLLEHTRAILKETEQCKNFHVFRILHAGLKSQQKLAVFGLENISFDEEPVGDDKQEKDFSKLVSSLKLIGFRENEIETIFEVLAAILNLREIIFEMNSDSSSHKRDFDEEKIQMVAKLLGIESKDLVEALSIQKVATRGEVILKENSNAEVLHSSNALIMGLYARLFDYIVIRINNLLSFSRIVYGESSDIGILDIFGFEKFSNNNSLEQLCINVANEQLHFYFNQFIFCWEREEYIREGIQVSLEEVPGNKDILETLLSRPVGLFAILDEESKFPSANDLTFLAKLDVHLKDKKGKVYSRPTYDSKNFIVRHYAGEVVYNSENFIDKNRNYLPPNLITTMRGSGNIIVRNIFSMSLSCNGRLVRTESNLDSTKSMNRQYSQTRSQQTMSTYFRYSLMSLLQTVLDGAPHFIRCIKPNTNQAPDSFDNQFVVAQLRYTGLLETVKARATGYTHRLSFSDFLRRYCFLGFSFDERVVATRENCQLLLLRLKMDGYALGRTKVFLKYYHIEYMAKQYEKQIRKIIRVQAVIRRWLASLRFQREKWSVARNVFVMKKFAVRWRIRASSKRGLSKPSASLDRSANLTEAEAALEIQRHFRGFITRQKTRSMFSNKMVSGVSKDWSFRNKYIQKKEVQASTPSRMSLNDMLADEKRIMLKIHLNNAETIKYIVKTKTSVEIFNVKQVQIGSCSSLIGKEDEEITISSDNSCQAFLGHFYNDSGPREDWDAPIRKFEKHQTKINAYGRRQKTTQNKLENICPIQSVIAQAQSEEFIKHVQNEVRRKSQQFASPIKMTHPKEPTKFIATTKVKPTHADVIGQLINLQKQAADKKVEKDDDVSSSGPYDFRVLLRKTNFGPTDSLRRHSNIPIIMKSSNLEDNKISLQFDGKIVEI